MRSMDHRIIWDQWINGSMDHRIIWDQWINGSSYHMRSMDQWINGSSYHMRSMDQWIIVSYEINGSSHRLLYDFEIIVWSSQKILNDQQLRYLDHQKIPWHPDLKSWNSCKGHQLREIIFIASTNCIVEITPDMVKYWMAMIRKLES